MYGHFVEETTIVIFEFAEVLLCGCYKGSELLIRTETLDWLEEIDIIVSDD